MKHVDTTILQHFTNKHYGTVPNALVTVDGVNYYIVKYNAYPQSRQVAFYISTDKKAKKNNIKGQFFAKFDDQGMINNLDQFIVY